MPVTRNETEEILNESVSSVEISFHGEDDENAVAVGAGHHSLPHVEEYRAQAWKQAPTPGKRPRSKISQKRRARLILLVSSLVIVGVIIIAVSVAVSNSNKATAQLSTGASEPNENDFYYGNKGDSQGVATNPPGDDRKKGIIELLTFMEWSKTEDLNTPGTPQYNACVWLADVDPMGIEIEDSLEFRQRYALAVFYYALKKDGKSWYAHQSLPWFTASSVCSWTTNFPTAEGGEEAMGVLCDGGTIVKALRFTKAGVTGALPDEIALLYDLEGLYLDDNALGTPLNVTKLTELQYLKELSVATNDLSGTFPSELTYMKLRSLNLMHNRLYGTVPTTSQWEDSMESLLLSYNDFEVDIRAFSNLPNIKTLDLADNKIQGNLSADVLSRWPNIEVLDLSGNHLTGRLPENLFDIESLHTVDLGVNYFTGALPTQVNTDANLKLLSLYNNKLNGKMDFVTAQLTNLQHLDLSNNDFSGQMPSFALMEELRYLFLSYNLNLEGGPIPPSLAELYLLVDLSLQKSRRTGTIPSEFGDLKKLVLFDVGHNELQKTIPLQLGQASSLAFLLVNHNQLTGSIPDSVGQLRFLRALVVDNNDLSGPPGDVCDIKPIMLDAFIADCSEISCPTNCCTMCCGSGDGNDAEECDDRSWNGNVDLVYDLQYKRSSYEIYRGDSVIYPVDTDGIFKDTPP